MSSKLFPLVLDLDGTVIHTDTFHEMMAYLLAHKPFLLLCLPFWLLKGRMNAKAQLLKHTDINLTTLPYNKELLSIAQQEGRPLILATGTHQSLAQKISDHLGIFQEVIGSEGKVNMTGFQKGKALCNRFGLQGFDYAGDSSIDTFIWKLSRKALIVCPKWGVLKKASALKEREQIHYIPREQSRLYTLFKALRPLFWILTLGASSISFGVAFSFLSSGLLIFNDLFLLEKERNREHKTESVFATGKLHLITGFTLAPLFILISLFLILFLSGGALYIMLYIPFFIILDRFTRHLSFPLRWAILTFFQASILFLLY